MENAVIEESVISEIKSRVESHRDELVQFMKELCAIPSYDSKIQDVGERAAAEMRKLGFDEVWFDQMGNIVGRIGDGPTKLLYDSHIDTVGVGNPNEWEWDPFEGKIENGVLFARGASDEKASTPGMIYGLAIARDLGLLEGVTGYYFGNMEEWCDGIAPNALVEAEGIKPDFVVIGEPTKMQVYRGHKGRVEMKVVAKGKSAHAASNHLGVNAIYKLLPAIHAVSMMRHPELADHPFLGQGRITITDMKVETPSINAVPDLATIYIDRRITFGEDPEAVVKQIDRIIAEYEDVDVEVLFYDEPSYTGFVFPVDKIFPAWALPENHPYVEAGLEAGHALWDEPLTTGAWSFSTNGTYWMGKAHIPSIGFGPGDEIHAHTVIDQVVLDDVVRATEWYALMPGMLPAKQD
jgi:putative selenium metabolism hydrolase